MKIGIIGGSGLDDPDILKDAEKIKKHTPYGNVSDLITVGKIKNVDVVMIPRHGSKHEIGPGMVNYRANIWAMKELGVTHILAPTACGSLREEYEPGNFAFIDQFIDRTTKRKQSFYEGHEVCHIPMADPFCDKLRKILTKEAKSLGIKYHDKGTMVTIEGPRFSTRAESKLFRSWDADTINMTTVPEVVLAREAGICYASIAMVTDYDCFLEDRKPVTVEEIVKTMKVNAENVKKLLINVIPKIDFIECSCKEDIKGALI